MTIPFSLRQLEYFVAVAIGGSVTAAAARCNVSQPSISVAISDLEALLGKMLFRRQAGHKLAITPAGRRLLKQARTTLAAASQISLKSPDNSAEAELSIACFRDLGSIYLPKMLQGYAQRCPKLSCLLTEGDLVDIRSSCWMVDASWRSPMTSTCKNMASFVRSSINWSHTFFLPPIIPRRQQTVSLWRISFMSG